MEIVTQGLCIIAPLCILFHNKHLLNSNNWTIANSVADV